MAIFKVKLADRMKRLHIKRLNDLVKNNPEYDISFFIANTNNKLYAKNGQPLTPSELLTIDSNFTIWTVNTSQEHKVIEVDLILYAK
jgi:hypothetical protein